MARTAKDALVRLFSEGPGRSADSATLTLPADALVLGVESVGEVSLPVRAAQVKKLLSVARPAHFGKGEETLLDPSVRDTWEISPAQVTLGGERWEASIHGALVRLGAEIGIPATSRLRAELHSMLVYGKGQFFAPHQDSEKHDDMVATLVVTLPSSHTGGELVVHARAAAQRYPASREELSLVAFYPDQRHEVLPVRSGHRLTLTFNVLLEEPADAAVVGPAEQAAALLRAHFATPVATPFGDRSTTPGRLALLLDHEYSRRGLSAGRLKGDDARRVALLVAAAESAGCEAVLAQAEIQETWDASVDDPYYYDYYGDGDEVGDSQDEPGLDSLIESTVVLTWWTDAPGAGEIELPLGPDEVGAVTPSVQLEPYASEHEGYMGNYGNTVDRWYRRAALVLWPQDQGFATRAEASPRWALETTLASLEAGETERACAEAQVLARVRGRSAPAGLLTPALRVAAGVDDGPTALAVLAAFGVEQLGVDHAPLLGVLAGAYPPAWWTGLREEWAGRHRYAAGVERRAWVETALVPVCGALASVGAPDLVTWLAGWMADWLVEAVASLVRLQRIRERDEQLRLLGPALAAVLAVLDDQHGLAVVEDVEAQGEVVLPMLVAAVRAQDGPTDGARRALAEHASALLTAFLTRPARRDGDWSVAWTSPGGQDPDRLATFLASATERTLDWPLAEPRRRVIHRLIEGAALPVSHVTRRTGRPYTLVLRKTDELFSAERVARLRAQQDLDAVQGVLGGGARGAE